MFRNIRKCLPLMINLQVDDYEDVVPKYLFKISKVCLNHSSLYSAPMESAMIFAHDQRIDIHTHLLYTILNDLYFKEYLTKEDQGV